MYTLFLYLCFNLESPITFRPETNSSGQDHKATNRNLEELRLLVYFAAELNTTLFLSLLFPLALHHINYMATDQISDCLAQCEVKMVYLQRREKGD